VLLEEAGRISMIPTVAWFLVCWLATGNWRKLSRRSDVLKLPRNVYVPKFTPRTDSVTAETFVLKVRVSKDGRVLTAAFIKPPQQAQIAREVLQKVKEALFRPALQEGKFVEADEMMRYSVELR
jgi:hypothetical protein